MRTFSNLAISLDGRIADSNFADKPLGTPHDRQTMQVIRKMADVILVGSSTLRAHPRSMKLKGQLPSSKQQPANAIVSANLNFDKEWAFWKDSEVMRLVFTTRESLSKAVELCEDRALVFDCGQQGQVDMLEVFKKLKSLQYKNVLVEGGGALMASVMEAKLLQEIFVTLTPWVLGGRHNPSIVMGENAIWQKLELLKSKKLKDELYLHYRVKGAKRV